MMIINYAFLLLFGFQWIVFVENSVLNSDGIKLRRAIIGGDLASPGQFPYAVSLQRYNQSTGQYKFICTATLITSMTILTAAHCVFREGYLVGDINDYIGVLGTVHRMDRTNIVTFQEICIHLNYSEINLPNDIALLILSKPIKLGDTVKAIPLIGAGLSVVGLRGISLGWGKTNFNDEEESQMLRYADVNIIHMEECKKIYKHLNDKRMCYGTEGKGPCKGDSGGPVVVKVRNVEVQVGIASYAAGKCSGLLSVGTNISSFNTWIQNNVHGTPVFIY